MATVADRVLVMADGEIVADGSARDVLAASPAFAPQVARILAPLPYLTVDDVVEALRRRRRRPRRVARRERRARPSASIVARRSRWRSRRSPGRSPSPGRCCASRRPGIGHETDAPLIFLILLPILVVVVLAEIAGGGIDSKALAMLGVLSAIGAALRPLGAGTAGIETSFFLLIVAGRVFGPGFGFVLGSTTLFASALLTGGVGPWLPFQMLAASWVGPGRRPAAAGAGPRARSSCSRSTRRSRRWRSGC